MAHTIRHYSRRTRWVAWCLLLSWATALAGPLINPVQLHAVCGRNGLELVSLAETSHGDGVPSALSLDCAACLPIGLPPPDEPAQLPLPFAQTRALGPVLVQIASFQLFPPPARGPPLFLLDHNRKTTP